MPGVAVFSALAAEPWAGIAGLLVLAGVVALLLQLRIVRGTTLFAPWVWLLLALVAIGFAELILPTELPPPAWTSHLRFAAAAVTFCPVMALLGAKRPQDRAWQFIVASLWIVVVLPSGEALLYVPDRPLDLHTTRRWFLLILVAVGALNALRTRFAIGGLLYAAGQVGLLQGQLPFALEVAGLPMPLLGLAAIVASTALRTAQLRTRSVAPRAFDRMWFDFRDAYGGLWALRVAERLNAVSAARGWRIQVGWDGWRPTADGATLDDLPQEHLEAAEQVFVGLLRRFVSRNWIAARQAGNPKPAAEGSSR